MESQVNGLAKMGLGKLVSFPNMDYESHAIRVTCIIILIILHKAHNILHITHIVLHIGYNMLHVAHIVLHITHNIFHFIHSYAMRPWNHIFDIKTSQNKGFKYGNSTTEPL